MTDPRKTTDDAAFERELAEASRAYRAADNSAAPPASMDDAIRAAARRAVQAAPRPVQKPWLLRFSKPLSVAAVLVLTASLLIVSFEERPELAPPMAENVGKIALPSQRARAAAETRAAVTDVAGPASRLAEQAPAAPPATIAATRNELALEPDRARRAESAPRQAVPAEEKIAAPAPVAPAYAPPPPPPAQIAAAPMPAPAIAPPADANRAEASRERHDNAAPVALARKEAVAPAVPAPVAAAAAGASAGNLAAEAKRAAPMLRAPVAAAAPAAAPVAERAAILAPQASPAPPQKVAGANAELAKAAETPEAWLKRIIELRQQLKPKEADEELARFRKRYPDFVIPTELKAATGNR